ncbi:unnamed protein product [Closterium sp. NIES-54]
MKLRAWSQLASVQDYTASFMAFADQVDDMAEAERLDKYISCLKYEIQIESPCWLSRRPAAACRVTLLAVASPCCCMSRRPASCRVAQLPPLASPSPARAPHCWQPRLAARAPPCWQPHRCPHRPARAALLADTLLPARRPAAHAPPCWPPPCPALAACRSSLVVRHLSLPCALP